MGRKRKNPADNWIPSRVYRGRSAWEYHPKGGGNIRLCALDAKPSEVLSAYEAAISESNQRFNMKMLAAMYFQGAHFKSRSPRTRKDYERHWGKLEPVFGMAPPDSIRPPHIRKYMDIRGQKAPVQANRERALLHNIFAFAYERGLVQINPCQGVKPFQEKARERYVTDAEYQAVYDIAPPNVKAAMEISYLCGARQGDVLALTRTQLSESGVYIQQGKTGKKQIKEWSSRLRDAIDLGISQPSKIESMFVIHTSGGMRYTSSGFKAIWKRVVTSAFEQKLITEKFTFHDLKRKAISDFDGDKQQFSGHKTSAMVQRYDNVKPSVVPTIGSRK